MQVSQCSKVNHGRKASQPIIETQDEKASQSKQANQRKTASPSSKVNQEKRASQRSKKPDMIERVNRS